MGVVRGKRETWENSRPRPKEREKRWCAGRASIDKRATASPRTSRNSRTWEGTPEPWKAGSKGQKESRSHCRTQKDGKKKGKLKRGQNPTGPRRCSKIQAKGFSREVGKKKDAQVTTERGTEKLQS